MDKPLEGVQEHEALKLILEGTSHEVGEGFFRALVRSLARALNTHAAWVTEIDPARKRLKAFSLWLGEKWVDDYEYAIAGTPCEDVIKGCTAVHVPEKVVDMYPDDPDLPAFGAMSYMGVPLVDGKGVVIGNLAVLDGRPMPKEPRAMAIIKIFAARAAAEISRIRVERALQAREEQVRRLVDSALDAIVQLDGDLNIVRVNPSAEKVFQLPAGKLEGRSFEDLLAKEAVTKLRRFLDDLADSPPDRKSTWVSGGLEARRADGTPFPAEASLARFEINGEVFSVIILRDENERKAAEQEIASLRRQTENLRRELQAIEGGGEILGGAPSIKTMLRDIEEVADTDATVLIQGETGTGKELVARAIHARSSRKNRPLVKLNCGAVPAALMESELFGHEKGAFTGATSRREGRFLMAHKGTLFLDEVGELPLDLQVKLLRVLQEGEFESVGGSKTHKVDVRVLAATNRNLSQEVEEGRFRSDLFYRLNVFPLDVPPLRDRKEDIPVLVRTFTERIAGKTGRRMNEIPPADLERLQASDWPGNIRELQNFIERAVITSRDGRLNLDRALPTPSGKGAPPSSTTVLTSREMEALERENLLRALEQTKWKVSGADGAAALLGIKPSTLTYRMKALSIERPR